MLPNEATRDAVEAEWDAIPCACFTLLELILAPCMGFVLWTSI